MFIVVKSRWYAPNGYREVLNLSIPLIIAIGSLSIPIQIFVDRLFLSAYSSVSARPSPYCN